MSNIGCRIYPDYARPDKAVVEAFRGMPVANIDDNMNRTAAVCSDIKPIGAGKGQMLGTAFTIKVAQGDNLMFHKAMDMAKPGDVIMIDAGGMTERSIFGSLMATYCKTRGIVGIVVDGSIRDCDEIAELKDFHVYARGITPNGPYKNGPGELRGEITLGGVVVHPGDIVVGDSDGVLVLRPEEAEELAEKTRLVMAKEADILKNILENNSYVRPWVDSKLAEIGCEEV
ncbi:MAG: RraA family protein [Clostridia bacterium]|nr:RraA family protein [Clostridia bacterium]